MPTSHCKYRGFNVYGPYKDTPQHVSKPAQAGVNQYTIVDCARTAAKMDSNIIRVTVNWGSFQPNPGLNGFDLSFLNQFKLLINAGRAARGNNNLMLLPVITGTPLWIGQDPAWMATHENDFYKRDSNGNFVLDQYGQRIRVAATYVTTEEGYSAYGYACAVLLSQLAGYANFIELSNEPNGPRSEAGTNIPETHYGRMAAYAISWVDSCFNATTPQRAVLVGSLAPPRSTNVDWITRATDAMYEVLREDIAPPLSVPETFTRLANSWRLSFHPYPAWQEDNWQTAIDQTAAFIDDLSGRFPNKVWITEVSVSSHKLSSGEPPSSGELRQGLYYVRLMASVIPERPKIEGLVYWPLTDAEPNAWDPSDNNFYKMGCIRPNNLLSNGDIDYKPAGAVAASFFANTQWG